MAERDLSQYVEVAERIDDFRKKYPEGSLSPWNPAEPWRLIQAEGFDKDGSILTQTFIVYVAAAYRHPGDPNPGVGMAWEIFPGRTPYTRGSELQNAETSAWGRAIIAVGASDSKRGIASREEVRNRQAEREELLPNCPQCNHLKAHHRTDIDPAGCDSCDCLLVWNKDGSLSRSRTSDAEKAGAGVMTDAEQREHAKLAKPPPNTGKVERIRPNPTGGISAGEAMQRAQAIYGGPGGAAEPMTGVAYGGPGYAVDAAVDDRWTSDASSWLVGVDPPEDQPGSILPAQRSQIMAVYTALGIKDREKRMADVCDFLEMTVESVNELSHQQAAGLLENLHERHTGKMTRR